MTTHRSSELGSETGEIPFIGRKLETLDDIPREIADRRLHAEFGEYISPEKSAMLRGNPDVLERPGEFAESARAAGMTDPEGLLGWSTRPEDPAHVLKEGDVGREIATLIHEDLHRLTHPETLREMFADPATRELYEGITEYLADRAVEGLHEHQSGEAYPEQVRAAEKLASEGGEAELRSYFFKHEMSEDLERALQRIREVP